MTLDDDDPLWEQHDGGSGHSEHPEWSAADVQRAAAFYAATRGRARSFLDVLINHPVSSWRRTGCATYCSVRAETDVTRVGSSRALLARLMRRTRLSADATRSTGGAGMARPPHTP
jgi:hypothetical protein